MKYKLNGNHNARAIPYEKQEVDPTQTSCSWTRGWVKMTFETVLKKTRNH